MDTTNNLFDKPDAVQDILSPTDKHSFDGYLNANIFGLNLSRSQSAAPMFSSLSSSVSPPRSGRFTSAEERSGSFGEDDQGKKRHVANGGLDDTSFLFRDATATSNLNSRNFFSNDNNVNHNEGEDAIPGFIRRPASTGGIDRNYNNDNDKDVSSILETLGLTSLESSEDIRVPSNGGNNGSSTGPNSSKKYFEDGSMITHKGDFVSRSSKASKYFTQDLSNGEEETEASQPSFPGYSINDYVGDNNGSLPFRQGGPPMQQQEPQHQPSLYSQFGQQQHDAHQQQWGVHDPVYFGQHSSQIVHQQLPHQLHNVMPGSQQHHTMYEVNSPTGQNTHHPSFGYDYQNPQQQQQNQQQRGGATPTMAYSHHQQPQFISIVPIQAAHHPQTMNGHSGYAYVQYGPDGNMQLHHPQPMPNSSTTFIMGPHGQPITLASVPINTTGITFPAALGSSPSDEGMVSILGSPRTPSRGGGIKPDRGPRTPSTANVIDGRGKTRGNGITSPRAGGKRGDKNAMVTSRMGPVAMGLMNEIRAAKSRNQWTVHDIGGHVVEFCLDQNGSRFIQQRLEVADAIEKKAVVDELVPSIKELQNDVFGNYVIQKLFEFGNDDIKRDLKNTLKDNMMVLSLQMYGCRVIQKALESLDYDDLCELLQEFKQNVLVCIQDQNGNHVMQKCIEVISIKAKEAEFQFGQAGVANTMAKSIQFIINDVLANVESLCCHPYGCRVLQRMLEHCVEFQKTATLDDIQLCHKTLMDDQYGNYVIQHVLQYGRDSDRDSLLNIIVQNDLLKLSRQKFASNVVEKLLKYGNSYQRNTIVREMLKVVSDDTLNQEGTGGTVVLLMVRDAYANYVVQTAIDVVPEGTEKRMLIDELKANEAHLRNYTFAKHIVAKLGSK